MHTKRLQLRSKKWLLSVLAACGLFLHGVAQNGVAINTTGASPDASAILDLSNSVAKGFLLPKFSSTSSVSSPATGLVIYQTSAPAGMYCNIGTSASPNWILLSSSTGTVTSVGLSMPSGFAVSNSPVTSSGTLAITTSLNGLVYGNGSGFANATVSAPLTYSAGTLGITQASSTTSGFLSSTDWNTFNNKLSGNQSITLSGDATGTGTTLIPLTLATVNGNVGTYNTVTVNAKGLVTAASNASYQSALNGTGYVKQSGATTSYVSQIPLTTDVTGILPVANGGTGASNNVPANYIFAGPISSTGAPAFRPVNPSDLPTNSNAYIQNSIASAQNAGFNISGSAIIGGNVSLGGTANSVAIPKFATAGSVVYSSSAAGVLASTTAGTSGQVLTSTGSGAPVWTSTLPIANGGTNTTTIGSAGSVIYSTGTQQASTAVGTSGQVLTSNGSGAPTFQSGFSRSNYSIVASSSTTINTSGSYQLIPGLTKSVTVSAGDRIIIHAQGSLVSTSTTTYTYSNTRISLCVGTTSTNGIPLNATPSGGTGIGGQTTASVDYLNTLAPYASWSVAGAFDVTTPGTYIITTQAILAPFQDSGYGTVTMGGTGNNLSTMEIQVLKP